jgi:uncharacterized protein YcbK (DUF882 family)
VRERGDRVLKNPTAPFSIGLGLVFALGVLLASVVAFPAGPAQSREPDKTLKLFFGHTGERSEFTFMRNGRVDRGEMRRLNHFLRDWRAKEDAKMDPELLELIWAIYKESRSRDYIHVVSAYRSPATNEKLRARSSGVAKNSQHRLGKAMDWYLPDVPLAKLRGIAMKLQGGGVGYYPRSGSPFVHTDTGNVRAWPRMSRQQLLALFPKGNTLHLPADGKPLPGYELAVANRKQVGSAPVLAYLDTGPSEAEETDRTGTETGSAAGWLRRVFPGDSQEDADIAEATPAESGVPTATTDPQQLVASEEDDVAPLPRSRPSALDAPAETLAAETIVALAEADTSSALSVPPLPRTRPDTDTLADSLGERETEVASLDVDSEDAIAVLATRLIGEQPAADPNSPVSLAFADAGEPALPSAADRAILTAFSSIEDSSAIREADATLVAAVIRSAAEEDRPAEPQDMVIAYAESELLQRETIQPAATGSVAPAGSGIVLAPDDADYADDESMLIGLIETTGGTEPAGAELAMPSPESELYRPPQAASEVADLSNVSGPPVGRYARDGETPSEDGFFSRLFASLIE